MFNGVIKSDGYNENDLKGINMDSMRKFIGGNTVTDDTFESLFNFTVVRAEGLIQAQKTPVESKSDLEKLMEMFESLSEEDKNKVRLAGLVTQKEIAQERINNIKEFIETPDVKETTTGEEVKEGGNVQGTEAPRKRGRPAKAVS